MRHAPLALLLALAACAPVTVAAPPTVEPPEIGDLPASCRSAGLASFTGQAATQELGVRMLVVSGARMLRWIGHGMMVTTEYSGDRLSIQLDRGNQVERASCG